MWANWPGYCQFDMQYTVSNLHINVFSGQHVMKKKKLYYNGSRLIIGNIFIRPILFYWNIDI